MSNDIERLLAAAADDTDRPVHTDIDAILARGRRSVRRSRIAVASTAVLTTAAIAGGLTTWSNASDNSEDPAGITIDRNGQVIDTDSGQVAKPAPPVSPLSDAEVLRRCKIYDNENLVSIKERGGGPPGDKAGVIDARWKVVVKTGDQNKLDAMFLAPDQSILSTCTMEGPDRITTYARFSTTEPLVGRVDKPTAAREPEVVDRHVRIPVPGVTRVLFNLATEKAPREARVGADGYYSLGFPDWENVIDPEPTTEGRRALPEPNLQRIRAYDAAGRQVYEWKYEKPVLPSRPTVGPDVKIKNPDVAPVEVALTKDPETGKPLGPVPPVSPASDDSIRTRCKKPDDAYFNGGGPLEGQDSRTYDAGKITPDWKVVLKTGTGIDFTALLVSPGDNVVAWCHMYDTADHYDFGRSAVRADGTFGIGMEWGQVPDGVSQIVVDLPKGGPVRALISNGYFIWGLTGGNSDIKEVRIRGFDAQGKKVYDARHQIDAS